ncbi:MAG: hypothetical protein MJH10_10475 [Epibacterium sp.]|nr:hypothetical protein [Epibacterium sp.]NQX73965.1 hypothetical protein [Epibacterium sp.]
MSYLDPLIPIKFALLGILVLALLAALCIALLPLNPEPISDLFAEIAVGVAILLAMAMPFIIDKIFNDIYEEATKDFRGPRLYSKGRR